MSLVFLELLRFPRHLEQRLRVAYIYTLHTYNPHARIARLIVSHVMRTIHVGRILLVHAKCTVCNIVVNVIPKV